MAYQRIVAKFGTALLTNGGDNLDKGIMSRLVGQLARLHEQEREVILVSSGAIAAGRSKLGLNKRVRDIPFKQVLASVGQHRLMNLYEQLFAEYNITVAQALLARADLLDRAGYLNARNTLLALLELKVICIVNENDVVAVDEIREAVFGDNDNLSAMVANLVDADLLLILTDIGGLYTADPHLHPDAKLIPEVKIIDAEIERLAADTPSKVGTGGMIAKVAAAKLATSSGVTVIIADGREPDVILKTGQGRGYRHPLPARSQPPGEPPALDAQRAFHQGQAGGGLGGGAGAQRPEAQPAGGGHKRGRRQVQARRHRQYLRRRGLPAGLRHHQLQLGGHRRYQGRPLGEDCHSSRLRLRLRGGAP